MPEPSESRVGVYIDFDNVVISRYDQLFGRGDFMRDRARIAGTDAIAERLETAKVDIGAILDYASSFGTIAVSRAYADWSAPANAAYQRQLINRAVDLAQLFQVTSGGKNGADIRLAVDVVEELYRLPDLTHVIIVAGDSDYIALAQSAKRLGRTVIGIGVAGATSRALMAACDEFTDYDELPGVVPFVKPVVEAKAPATAATTAPRRASRGATKAAAVVGEPAESGSSGSRTEQSADSGAESGPHLTKEGATDLLVRAIRITEAKSDDTWSVTSAVKNQMLRMDSSFKEKTLGFKTFSDFLASHNTVIEIKKGDTPNVQYVRLLGDS
jgi:hypothetical protein